MSTATLRMSINGAAVQTGGITVAAGATCQLSAASTVGWKQRRYEIYSYPVGFALPAGWAQDTSTGTVTGVPNAYYYNAGNTPPIFTLSPWGKFLFRLKVDENTTGGAVETLTDDTCGTSSVSTVNSLQDTANLEDGRFGGVPAASKANLRIIEAGLGGGGGSTPTGTGIPHVVGGVMNAATSLIVNADVSAGAAIAASKVVQATGTGIPHVVAGALSAASSLVVNADVDAAAAIAGSKIAANFGAQAVLGTSFEYYDAATPGPLPIGAAASTTAVNVSKAGAATTVKGTLTVDQASTLTGAVACGATIAVGASAATTGTARFPQTSTCNWLDTTDKPIWTTGATALQFGSAAAMNTNLVGGTSVRLGTAVTGGFFLDFISGSGIGRLQVDPAQGLNITNNYGVAYALTILPVYNGNTSIGFGSTTTSGTIKHGTNTLQAFEANGTSFFATAGSFGSGNKVIFIANATTEPTTNPTGGALQWAFGGAIKARGSSGTATTMAAAAPHCDRCGRDFMHERENNNFGDYVRVCIPCDLESREADQVVMREIAAALAQLGKKIDVSRLIHVDQFAVRKLAAA